VTATDLGLVTGRDAPPLEFMTLDEAERHLIEQALRRCDGNVSEAARALGVSRSALYRRMQRHGL
jgi:transcriptional regulator of acetoin/glycerol metabolism